MDSIRGALQWQFDFAREEDASPLAELLGQESTDPARMDQPALSASPADALMERIVAPENLDRTWRQPGFCHQARDHSQPLLVDVSHTCHALRDAEQVAGEQGLLSLKQLWIELAPLR